MTNTLTENKNRTGIEFLFALLILANFFRYGLQVDLPTLILGVIAGVIILVGTTDEIVAVCMCCIPLYTSFEYLYVVLLGCVVLVVKNLKKIKIDCFFLLLLFIMVWELLHSFTGDLLIKQVLCFFIPFLFICVLHACNDIEYDYDYIMKKFATFVGCAGIIFVTQVILESNMNIGAAIDNMQRLGTISNEASDIGGAINPNSFGIMVAFAITVLLQSYLYKGNEKKKIVYIVVLAVLGLLTLSRTYIVLLLLMLFLFMIGKGTGLKQKRRFIGTILVVIFLVGIVVGLFLPNTWGAFTNRWLEDDLSNGRLMIMSEVSEQIWSSPKLLLFGIGIQDYAQNVRNFVSFAPHDGIHEMVLIWGWPGTIFFLIYICTMVLVAKKRNNCMGIVNIIPLALLFAKAMAGHFLNSSYTMLMLALVYLSLINNFIQEKDDVY